MAVTCPSCGAEVPDSEVEAALGVVQCFACEHVFEVDAAESPAVASEPPASEPPASEPPASELDRHPERAPLVEGQARTTIRDHGDRLEIGVPWFSCGAIPMLGFALVWNGFLVVWYAIALGSLVAGEPDAAMALVFPLLHVAVGVGVGYTAVANLINATTVTVTSRGIDFAHGPLWWPGAKAVSTAGLHQLYVVSRRVKTKNGHRVVYDLKALTDQGDIDLLKNYSDAKVLLEVEQRIEARLGIVDRPMIGEYLR